MSNLRVLTIGGLISYRALFGWLNPAVYTLTILIPSLTQLAFFVFLGRAAHVEDDAFFVAGNALVAAATPSLFGMAQAVAGERYTQTLAILVVSPASRVAMARPIPLPPPVTTAALPLSSSIPAPPRCWWGREAMSRARV